jgi:hypothetical protein
MYFSRDEIKRDLLDRFDEISGAVYVYEEVQMSADGYVPVHYHQILTDWAEMPSEFNDSWQEFGANPDKGIFSLMSADLFVYYQDLTVAVWDEILAEKAELSDEAVI